MLTVTAQSPMPTRFHPRVGAGFMVKLLVGNRTIVAKAEDVSMAGLKLVGELDLGRERVTVCLPLPEDQQVVTEATVRRREAGSLALEFDELDWDDLFTLARFLHPRLP